MKGSFKLACCIEHVVLFRSYQQHTRTSWLSVPDSILSSMLHARTNTFHRVYNGNLFASSVGIRVYSPSLDEHGRHLDLRFGSERA